MIPSPNLKNIVMLSSLVLFGCASAPPMPVRYPVIQDIPQDAFANIALQKTFIGHVL